MGKFNFYIPVNKIFILLTGINIMSEFTIGFSDTDTSSILLEYNETDLTLLFIKPIIATLSITLPPMQSLGKYIFGGLLNKNEELVTDITYAKFKDKFGTYVDADWLAAKLWFKGEVTSIPDTVENPEQETALPIFYSCTKNDTGLLRSCKLYLTYNDKKSEQYITFILNAEEEFPVNPGKYVVVDFPYTCSSMNNNIYLITIFQTTGSSSIYILSERDIMTNVILDYFPKHTLYKISSQRFSKQPDSVSAIRVNIISSDMSTIVNGIYKETLSESYYVYYFDSLPTADPKQQIK